MKKSFLLSAALFMSSMAFAQAVPADLLLESARSLKAQTGPSYFASGDLSCYSHNMCGMIFRSCKISMDGKSVDLSMEDSFQLIKALAIEEPHWDMTAKFSVSAVHREVPPYDVRTHAEVSDIVMGN